MAPILLFSVMLFFSSFLRRSLLVGSLLGSLLLPRVQAALLTAGYETQLETWLGQGNLGFTNIFTKNQGDDVLDFYAATANRGATFTLMSITGPGFQNVIIGGYNPASWNAALNNFNYTYTDAGRTAFIFNLTTPRVVRQNLIGQGFQDSGNQQTLNQPVFGFGWGSGFDLRIFSDLGAGNAHSFSYGAGLVNVVTGIPGSSNLFSVNALEVYSFASASSGGPGANPVPDAASTAALMAMALAGLGALVRRARRV